MEIGSYQKLFFYLKYQSKKNDGEKDENQKVIEVGQKAKKKKQKKRIKKKKKKKRSLI